MVAAGGLEEGAGETHTWHSPAKRGWSRVDISLHWVCFPSAPGGIARLKLLDTAFWDDLIKLKVRWSLLTAGRCLFCPHILSAARLPELPVALWIPASQTGIWAVLAH